MKCIVAFVYLLICSTSLLSGGPLPFLFEQQFDPQRKVGDASAVADKKWLSTQADTLLAIIKVLFKGDEATVIRYNRAFSHTSIILFVGCRHSGWPQPLSDYAGGSDPDPASAFGRWRWD